MAWLENACPIDRRPKAGETEPHRIYGDYCYKGFRHSLCHGWSAGVIPYLFERVAGIKLADKGFNAVRFEPRAELIKQLYAVYPTPRGDITVEFDNGKADIRVPEGVGVIGSRQNRKKNVH